MRSVFRLPCKGIKLQGASLTTKTAWFGLTPVRELIKHAKSLQYFQLNRSTNTLGYKNSTIANNQQQKDTHWQLFQSEDKPILKLHLIRFCIIFESLLARQQLL